MALLVTDGEARKAKTEVLYMGKIVYSENRQGACKWRFGGRLDLFANGKQPEHLSWLAAGGIPKRVCADINLATLG